MLLTMAYAPETRAESTSAQMKRRKSDSGGFYQSTRGINDPIGAGPSRGITSNSQLLTPCGNGSHGAEAMSTGNAVGKTQASSRARPRSKRFVWSDALHRAFILAVFQCGMKSASPKVILQIMHANLDNERNTGAHIPTALTELMAGVNTEHIKSHLQKFRQFSERSQTEFLELIAESNSSGEHGREQSSGPTAEQARACATAPAGVRDQMQGQQGAGSVLQPTAHATTQQLLHIWHGGESRAGTTIVPVAHRLAQISAQIQALQTEYTAKLSKLLRQQATLVSELPSLVPAQPQRHGRERAWKRQTFDGDLVVAGGTTVDCSKHITGVHATAEPGQAMEQMGALRAILREQRQEVTHKIGLAGVQRADYGDRPAAATGQRERKRANSARSVPPKSASVRHEAKRGKVHADSPLSLSPVGKAECAINMDNEGESDDCVLEYSHLDDAELFDFLIS